MEYTLIPNRTRRTLEVRIRASNISGESSILRLSKWRPGRYELGDFDRKIHAVQAFDLQNNPLNIVRQDSHSWKLDHSGCQAFVVKYDFYANQPDAGGSYLDDNCFYVNGINCLLYTDKTINEPCTLRLELREDEQIACGATFVNNTAKFPDFHELVDHPFIASAQLKHHQFTVSDHDIHVWFYGSCSPDFDRIEQDFTAFSKAQIDLFGTYPEEAYHYLFLIHDEFAYHGVEHRNSTVITLGPGSRIMGNLYDELLGVSSHEFFHAWNVKSIRPKDLLPYNYGKAVPSQMHYVTEGITTYYGDLMLLRSGVWSLEQYLKNFNRALLSRHYGDDGHRYISLEDASFSSWSGAYSPGVPNRKISFYTKGALVAFLLDIYIRQNSDGTHSLDSLMQAFFERFGGHQEGYTKTDFIETVQSLTGNKTFIPFYENYYSGLAPLDDALVDAAEYLGLTLTNKGWLDPVKQWFGLSVKQADNCLKVTNVFENSPGEVAGFHPGDEIIAIGNIRVNQQNHPEQASLATGAEMVPFHFFRKGRLMEVVIEKAVEPYGLLTFDESAIVKEGNLATYEKWSNS